MIDCFNLETAHLFGDALAEQHRLRHRIFVERLGWEMPSIRRMEYDQYDTPATYYLLWRDENGAARGIARLNPTDRPYLLKEIFPEFVTMGELPETPRVWEGTRFGVDRDLDPATRQMVIGELLLGCLEFALGIGVRQYVVLMPLLVLKKIFPRMGCEVELIGPHQRVGKDLIAPALCDVSEAILHRVRKQTGTTHSILTMPEVFVRERAA
jgi:acyl homoserine lactone synthase